MSAPVVPRYLHGRFEPVPDETEACDLPVRGALPTELNGRYIRNGPNPRPGETPGHLMLGAGMLHGVRLVDGHAAWYRNRWVRTADLEGRPRRRADGTVDLAVTAANTHLVEHAGKLLALCENGLPYRIGPHLDTVGPIDFDGRLHTAMTAHPKKDPVTGELHFFGYALTPPYATYHRVTATGALTHSRAIDLPTATMMHDFAVTRNFVVWLDLPLVFDPVSLADSAVPVRWDEHHSARIGLMRRDGKGDVRWHDIDPCYVFHVGNAWEDDAGRVVLHAVRHGQRRIAATFAAMSGHATGSEGTADRNVLYRWTIDPARGTVAETPLDDLSVEFPTIDERRAGGHNRYLYAVTDAPEPVVARYDIRTGRRDVHRPGPGTTVGEAVFVPGAHARAEDEGWLLTIVTDRTRRTSELLVLDASDISGPAVARVQLPRAVPSGFHGSWVPDTAG